MKLGASSAAFALILVMSVPLLADPQTSAQAALGGAIQGKVSSDVGGPLGGAFVNAVDAGGNTQGSSMTEPDGSYALKGLAPGTYKVTATGRGHADANATVVVAAVPVTQDFTLKHTGSVIRGTVLDGATGKGIEGVRIDATGGTSCPPNQPCILAGEARSMMVAAPTSTLSGAGGKYALGVEPGSYQLHASKEGWRETWQQVEAQQDATMDLKLTKTPPHNSVLQGRVTDAKTGAPIADAYVNAYPNYPPQPACPPDADCAAVAVMPCCGDGFWTGNSTQTDREGRYKMLMYAGDYVLSAGAQDFGQAQQQVSLAEGETETVDLKLEPIPPDSVTIQGTVLDKVTGKPVSGAWVSVENQQWGAYTSGQTDDAGRFSVKTKPGWAVVWVRADGGCCVYATPVAEPQSASPSGSAGTASSDAPPSGNETGIRAPDSEPRPYRQPSGSYYPWVQGGAHAENAVVTLDVQLVPKPGADARIVGYVLNATSKKPVVGAWVNVHNEDTGDWGSAQTDKDGSYVMQARAGVHTVQAYADGYYQNAVVAKVSGAETRIDLALQPGRQQGHCCIAYGRAEAASGTATPTPMAAGAPAQDSGKASAPQSVAQVESSGPATYQASPQGLGPYNPATAPSSPPPGPDAVAKQTPLPGALAVLAAVGAAAVLLTRRRK